MKQKGVDAGNYDKKSKRLNSKMFRDKQNNIEYE